MPDTYARHIAECNAHMQSNHKALGHGLLFVIATIQQQLETVPEILKDFGDKGPYSGFAFGFKREAVDWIKNEGNIATLYAALETVRHARQAGVLTTIRASIAYMRLLTQVPGLGLVKAGFAAQLYDNVVGCLDVHNIKLYDIPLNTLRLDKSAKEETQLAKVKVYVARCAALGGSEVLWRGWCKYKAAMRPQNWKNGGISVSGLHSALICETLDFGAYLAKVDQTSMDFEPRFAGNREE